MAFFYIRYYHERERQESKLLKQDNDAAALSFIPSEAKTWRHVFAAREKQSV
ncbi:MAG: hypothetical protein Q7R76_03885 [Candidatus Woesearchaeota archaeon]|nr:hypothetical protein [Candidatus Woesearchaeota archaeon]